MLPKLKTLIESNGLTFWQTTDNKIGTGFTIEHCDLESNNSADFAERLTLVLKALNPNVLGRVHLKCYNSTFVSKENFRSEAIDKLGYKSKRVYFYINHLPNAFDFQNLKSFFASGIKNTKEVDALLDIQSSFKSAGFKVQPLHENSIEHLFEYNFELSKNLKSIETPFDSIGVIRLTKQNPSELDLRSLNRFLNSLTDYEISVSFRRLAEAHSKLLLEKRLKQQRSHSDISSKTQTLETEKYLKSQFERGIQLFETEFLIIINRTTEELLLKELQNIVLSLHSYADFKIETYGVAESYIASHPASEQHVTLLESDETLPMMLPLFFESDVVERHSSRSLTLFRSDKTVSNFDLFDPKFSCFNSIIVGTSGKGKSVLTGLLTRALLTDPNISVIKVDVGGSHSKECSLLSGTEYALKLDEPSGINPFAVLKTKTSDSEKIAILSKFLSVLIQENGESSFTKELRSQIEDSISAYLGSNPEIPNIDDFFNSSKDFPRKNLLKRWVTGGLYESAFKTFNTSESHKPRLRYYNFSQVFQASDPEFAQAGIAAVLAQFNIDCIEAKGKRLVLICDETPFFIKSCFDFFKFSTANVRKYGHAVILISQLSTDLIVGGDSGIIENSPQRFLFSVDGSTIDYQRRFNLSDVQIESIKNLKSFPKVVSQVYLQLGEKGKTLSILITPEEYWSLTSSQPDQVKLNDLMKAVPGLKLNEAISCLSLS